MREHFLLSRARDKAAVCQAITAQGAAADAFAWGEKYPRVRVASQRHAAAHQRRAWAALSRELGVPEHEAYPHA